jgi:rhamnogalacturonan endolyase
LLTTREHSTGSKPSADLNTTFFSSLSIQGYVPPSQRGTVSGVASGVAPSFQAILHWHNTAAQYWTQASPDGTYTSPLMKPGTYTMKLYRNEFLIAQDTVTIKSGTQTTKNITSTEVQPEVIWRIGEFDGQPFELKNGDKMERMHPSDVRMGSWGGNYTVGKSTAKEFPMALFAKQGGVGTVTFDLAANQAAVETVLRIGTTLSFKGGRPSVKVNNWQGKDPGAPVCTPESVGDHSGL